MPETIPQPDAPYEQPKADKSISDTEPADPHANKRIMDRVLQTGSAEDLIRLLDSGFDINQGDWQGRTALMLKVAAGDVETVTELLERKADVNRVFVFQGRLAFSALDTAEQTNRPALAELLKTYGAKHGKEIVAAQSEAH